MAAASARVASARAAAAEADTHERQHNLRAALQAHEDAARLFRLASVAADVAEKQQQEYRMLGRHHETRARECREAVERTGDTNESISMGSGELSHFVGDTSASMLQPAPMHARLTPDLVPPGPGPRAVLVEAFEALWDKFFPKSSDALPPVTPDSATAQDETNRLMESFLVLPDYSRNVPGRTVTPTSERDAELRDLRAANAQLTRQNEALAARVAELEAQRESVKESVMQFRHELERSVRHDASMLVAPGLETLLDMDARSVLQQRLSPAPGGAGTGVGQLRPGSPSPDLVEYIRALERRVEAQAIELGDMKRQSKRNNKRP